MSSGDAEPEIVLNIDADASGPRSVIGPSILSMELAEAVFPKFNSPQKPHIAKLVTLP